MAGEEDSASWAVTLWACDLVLTAFNFLDRVIGFLQFGPTRLARISRPTPNAVSRLVRLRSKSSVIAPGVTQVGPRRPVCTTA